MSGVPVTPPGLEWLLQVSAVQVKQTRESVFQSHSSYSLLNEGGQLLYRAEEDRECCGPRFNVHICDPQGHEVLNLLLPSTYCSWETQMQVISAPEGMLLGFIDKTWASMTSSFKILTHLGEPVLKVHGPGWGAGFMSDAHHEVTLCTDRTPLGVITHVWKGVLSINDTYVVRFPVDLDVKLKALLVSCAILIDYLHSESQRERQQRQ